MARRMIMKYARNMTPTERQVCAGMSYKGNGDLVYFMQDAVKDANNTRAVLYKDDEKIVGWALMTDYGDTGFWVRNGYRRQGIGTKMLRRLEKESKKNDLVITVHPHSKTSGAFFYKNGYDEGRSYVD